jgi:16S rRNA (cytosine1402-N4)-methyltransferase
MGVFHQPVMVDEVLAYLKCQSGGIYVDGTLGGGGHAEAILTQSAPDGLLVGIDRDEEALEESRKRLAHYGSRVVFRKGDFAQIKTILGDLGFSAVDGILLDLGVSAHQLDTADRGFSFNLDGPLDMRMDRSQAVTAGDLIAKLSVDDLTRIIQNYGEEPMARRIAHAIAVQRKTALLQSTQELSELVLHALPPRARRKGIHPATRTFQALRIAVNEELKSLRQALKEGIDILKPHGRFCVISFHSLEDRIVKEAFRTGEHPCICPAAMPVCSCGKLPVLKVINRRPLRPREEEVRLNPRARSARMRTAERMECP